MSGRQRPPRRAGSGAASGSRRDTDQTLEYMTEVDHIALRVAQQPVRLRTGDTMREVPAVEAILMAAVKDATGGNSHASWLALAHMSRAAERHQTDLAIRRRQAADFQLFQMQRIAQARAAGRDTTQILPHPDDIDPDHPDGPRFTGPVTKAEWESALRTVRLREAWLLQAALECSLDTTEARAKMRKAAAKQAATGQVAVGKVPSRIHHVTPGDSLCMAELADLFLPDRLRRGSDGMVSRMMALSGLSQRVLLKQTRAAWAAAGLDLPRGTRAPPGGQMVELLAACTDAIREVLAPGFDPRDVDAVAGDLWDEAVEIGRAWNGGAERMPGSTRGSESPASRSPEASAHGGRHGA